MKHLSTIFMHVLDMRDLVTWCSDLTSFGETHFNTLYITMTITERIHKHSRIYTTYKLDLICYFSSYLQELGGNGKWMAVLVILLILSSTKAGLSSQSDNGTRLMDDMETSQIAQIRFHENRIELIVVSSTAK